MEWVQPGTAVINVASYKVCPSSDRGLFSTARSACGPTGPTKDALPSCKNVDEAELLKVPGVKYCPLVGKVAVGLGRIVALHHRPSTSYRNR